MMERLTDKYYRNFDPWECCGQDKYCQRGCHDPGGCTNGCIVPKLYCRLASYEDAEQDGRLVVLPCKVGDSVYIPDLEKKIPVKVKVQGISISVSGRTILRFGGCPAESAWGDGCGKDWFLTREEAEAELLSKEETK